VDWLKLNSKGILRGSLAISPNTTQLVWIKFLAMANETRNRDGFLHYAEGRPYSRSYIAETCNVSMEALDEAINEFLIDIRDGISRIQIAEDGTIFLTNFNSYQEPPEGKGKEKLTGRELELYQRAQLNKLAEKFPIEALNVEAVKRIRQGELDDEDTT